MLQISCHNNIAVLTTDPLPTRNPVYKPQYCLNCPGSLMKPTISKKQQTPPVNIGDWLVQCSHVKMINCGFDEIINVKITLSTDW